mgnify:CR=1 FL=1
MQAGLENFEAGRNNRFRIYRRLPANERLPPPPDGRGRSSRGRASLTLSVRPFNSLPLSALHGSFRFGFFIHGDERKAARFAGHAVHHQRDFADLAMLFEKILKIVFSGLKERLPTYSFIVIFWSKLASYRAVPGNRVSNHH